MLNVNDKINCLIEKWEQIARNKFISADRQATEPCNTTAKRFIEHGAMCYFNCAQELRAILTSLSPSSSTTQEGDQK